MVNRLYYITYFLHSISAAFVCINSETLYFKKDLYIFLGAVWLVFANFPDVSRGYLHWTEVCKYFLSPYLVAPKNWVWGCAGRNWTYDLSINLGYSLKCATTTETIKPTAMLLLFKSSLPAFSLSLFSSHSCLSLHLYMLPSVSSFSLFQHNPPELPPLSLSSSMLASWCLTLRQPSSQCIITLSFAITRLPASSLHAPRCSRLAQRPTLPITTGSSCH